MSEANGTTATTTATNRIETAKPAKKKPIGRYKRALGKLEKIGDKKAANYTMKTDEGNIVATTKGRVCLSVGEVAKQAGKEGAKISAKGADGVGNTAVITGQDAEDFILDDMAEDTSEEGEE